ncbi:hypothetical protein [Cellulomonas oligotrophica]|uniref:Uncharacterized protein n=1 Tax=Cellulomonas oligotrophica TaxID=931536 RepID=A0A7Y9JZT9_9CELL|nr:hypothetical protein [Cellulomonas oligotrophica]NYD86600.1 hypothetical protein [Cellulomonas oligotrophica]GIG32510.1 hypothetical protein Col01nite_16690 [Cellulomonas oligotrophica]
MSTDVLRWSDDAVVTTHDWGVLVHDERGVHQLRGSGLERPVAWIRERLTEPTDPASLLAPLPDGNRARMGRLVDSLVARGAITVERSDASATRTLHAGLRTGPAGHRAAQALATLLEGHGVVLPRPAAALSPGLAVVDGDVHPADAPERAVGFRLVLRSEDVWLGLFRGDAADRAAGAQELLRYLGASGAAALPGAAHGAEAWLPWVARTLAATARPDASGADRCVRLTVDPFAVHEHRLVRTDGDRVAGGVGAVEDLSDPLVISRRCAHLVDDVTSPVGVPSEAGLRQLPLQLSGSTVRHADGSREVVLGHGWTLEHARGHAVGQAVLRYGLSRLSPSVTAQPLAQGSRPGAPVVLRRDDVLRATAGSGGVASLGATAHHAAHAAAVQLAARLAATDPQVTWHPAPLPPSTTGADLLATDQECDQMLVAQGLPFDLVALRVAPDAVVMGASDHGPRDAAEAAVVQALLRHQSRSPGNGVAAPRTYRPPAATSDGVPDVTSLAALLGRHGTPLVVPLSGGPSVDAVLPHQVLVLLAPGGSRP